MLKSLSICAAAFLLVGCSQSYPSMYEADNACEEWKNGGTTISVKYSLYDLNLTDLMKVSSRRCVVEENTSQFLGFEISEKELEQFKGVDQSLLQHQVFKLKPKGKLVKHFRF